MDYKPMLAVANTDDSSISLLDPNAWEETGRIQLPAKSGPYDLLTLGSGQRILVTLTYADALAYINLADGKVVEIMTIGRRPCHIAYDATENLAFITNSDTDTVSMVSIARAEKMKLIGQIQVGSMPQGIDFDHFTRDIAVANFNTADITIINADDLSIKSHIELEQNPVRVKYSPRGDKLYITCISSYNNDIGSVVVVDMTCYEVLCRIALMDLPGQLYITSDEKYVLVTSMGRGGLEIIDIFNRKSLMKVPTNGMTQGIALDNRGKYAYVTNPDDNSISKVDWRLGKKVATIGVGREPNGIVYV
jgi:YVTN family beta-propeller protein